MNDLRNTADIVKKQSLILNDGLSEVADAAMELVGKHMQIAVKGLASDVETKIFPYAIPFTIVIPFLVFSVVNLIYKSLVFGLLTQFSEQMSLPVMEITASAIILIIALAVGYYFLKKLKKPTDRITSLSKDDLDPMYQGVNH